MRPCDVFFDRQLLAGLTGSDVRAGHLRDKPGLSCIGALSDPATGRPVSWLQVATAGHLDKLRNTVELATEIGADDELVHQQVPGTELLALSGPIGLDPRLVRTISKLDSMPGQVLRYNPRRRVVVRHGDDAVLRITAGPHRRRLTDVVRTLATALPVVRPLRAGELGLPHSDRLSVWPWIPGCDLAELGGAGALHAAGSLLARVHQTAVPSSLELPIRGWDELLADARAVASGLGGHDAELGARAMRVLDGLGRPVSGELVLSHGDFSADQVIGPSLDELVISDWDRACIAPPELDLATAAAAALATGDAEIEAIAEGYRAAGGPGVASGAWTAASLALRLMEPWRSTASDWRAVTAERLRMIEELACE